MGRMCSDCPFKPVVQMSLQKPEVVENIIPEVARGLMLVQSWLHEFLATERRKDNFFRLAIVTQRWDSLLE